MKTNALKLFIITMLLGIGIFATSCVTDQQQGDEYELEASQQGEESYEEEGNQEGNQEGENLAEGEEAEEMNNAPEDNEFNGNITEENNLAAENVIEEDSPNALMNEGEEMNNAPAGEEFVNEYNQQNEIVEEETVEPEAIIDNATMASMQTDIDSPTMDTETSNAVANEAAIDGYMAASSEEPSTTLEAAPLADQGIEAYSAPQSSESIPTDNRGIVKYVMPGGTEVYANKNQQEVVNTLVQGDHPLVWEEGEWSRTSDGQYIPISTLSSEPIGRERTPAIWQ